MFKLVVNQDAATKDHSFHPMRPAPTHSSRDLTSGISVIQRAIGDQAVQRISQNREQNADAKAFPQKPLGSGHDFSRMPVHPLSNSGSEKLTISEPGDRYEHEADRVAEQMVSGEQPSQSDQRDVSSRSTESVHDSVGNQSSGGHALNSETRHFFEPRFSHSFSNVRIHSDHAANESARSLGARAYTSDRHIFFASGEYQPSTREGRQLLAHELAHVVQQSHVPQQGRPHTLATSLSRVSSRQVQRKLNVTGDTAGFAAMANSIITVQSQVVVSSAGEVSLRSTDVQGPPTREQQELVTVLQRVIGDPTTTAIQFIHGATSTTPAHRSVLIGAYATAQIDLDDVAALGSGLGGTTTATALVHEITEQYRRQVHGEAFAPAHRAGERAEEVMSGAIRGTHTVRQINPTTVEITVPWTYPDGRVVDVVMTVANGNVTNVTRNVRRTP